MIKIENITLQIASKYLLENASAQIDDGAKVGILGSNGCGKTTLFKTLKGEHEVNSGDIFIPSRQIKAFAEQEIKDIDLNKTILDYVLSKDKRLIELRESKEKATPLELADIIEELKIIGSDSAEARTAEILRGLGFNQEDLTRKVKDFSGGWQMRLNLAGALFQYSDILFLDEPTNHLDIEAIVWLKEYLKRYNKTLLLISHDRDFLNNVCNTIIHFEGKKLISYKGNYDSFLTQYNQKIELTSKAIEKQNQRKAHLQSFVDRFRYKATKAKQAQSRLKMLEKMADISEIEQEREEKFTFPEISPLPSPLIKTEKVSVGYEQKVVLKNLNLYLNQDDRIALLGKNGNGKSTLVKMLSDRLKVFDGTVVKSKKLKIGYFHQNQTEILPLDNTPTEYMQSLSPTLQEKEIRSYLARFGLEQEKAITKIKELSGGEKTRLLFASMSFDAPELLIFDEPTNHLDIKGRKALAEAINMYNGAIILISHDFYLLELVADTLWLVDNNTCTIYDGSLEDYRDFLLQKTPKDKESKEHLKEQTSNKNTKEERKARVKLREIEKNINKKEERKAQILEEFTKTLEPEHIISLQKELKTLEEEIEDLEWEWFKLQDD